VRCGEHMPFSQRLTRPHQPLTKTTDVRAVAFRRIRPLRTMPVDDDVDQRCLIGGSPTAAVLSDTQRNGHRPRSGDESRWNGGVTPRCQIAVPSGAVS
jgi:hypothetical protein